MASRHAAGRAALVAAVLVAGAAVGIGCGGSGDDDTTASTPAILTGVTAPTAPAAPETVPAEPGVPTATTGVPVRTEPDAGDEEGIRVPATFALEGGALNPPRITVPPQLPIAVRITAKDGKAHTVAFATKPPITVEVPAGGPGTARIPGQRKGTYTASIDGAAPVPALVAVDDAGP